MMNVASVVTNNCFENIRLRKFLTAQSILELCGFYCSPKLGYHLGGKNKPLKSSLAELTYSLSFKVQVLTGVRCLFFRNKIHLSQYRRVLQQVTVGSGLPNILKS